MSICFNKTLQEKNPTIYIFPVTISSSKKEELTEFDPCVPSMKYPQYYANTCCLSILQSVNSESG